MTSKTLEQSVAKPTFIYPLLHHTYFSPGTHIQQMYFIHTYKIKRKLSSTEYLSFLFWRFIRVQSVSPPLENPSPLSRPHCQFEKAFLSVNGLLCVQYYQLKKIDISRQLKKFSKYIILLLKIRNATSIQTSDAKNAKRVRLYTYSKTCRALQASTRLRI